MEGFAGRTDNVFAVTESKCAQARVDVALISAGSPAAEPLVATPLSSRGEKVFFHARKIKSASVNRVAIEALLLTMNGATGSNPYLKERESLSLTSCS